MIATLFGCYQGSNKKYVVKLTWGAERHEKVLFSTSSPYEASMFEAELRIKSLKYKWLTLE